MKIGPKIILISALTTFYGAAFGQTNTPAFANSKEKASYGVGVFFGNQIKRGNLEVNMDTVVGAMKDVLEGREPKLTQQQAQEAIMTYTQQRNKELAAKNTKAGEAFLAENKKKDGVQTKEVALEGNKTAELQYKILTDGTGDMPKATDTVKVNYRGTLVDGTEFDSSAKHGGKPAQFPVNRVVRGWTEALQMMKVGSKWQLFIPASLGYGERPMGNIPPGSTLVFDVELVGINEAAPAPELPAQPKPLTSDIIRVPSAEEMKSGAKIQVIKAADVEKSNAVQNATAPK